MEVFFRVLVSTLLCLFGHMAFSDMQPVEVLVLSLLIVQDSIGILAYESCLTYLHFGLFLFQAIASPREFLLNKVPAPMPTPTIFNLDAIEALATDNIVSKDGLPSYLI